MLLVRSLVAASLLPLLLALASCTTAPPRDGAVARTSTEAVLTASQRLAQARTSLEQARRAATDSDALAHALVAAQLTWPLLPTWQSQMAGDPEAWGQSAAALIYNEASARAATHWLALGKASDSAGLRIQPDAGTLGFFRGSLAVDTLLVAQDVKRSTLKENRTRPGIGGALVGVIEATPERLKAEPFMASRGYRMPLTAVWDFGSASSQGARAVQLRVLRASTTTDIVLRGREVPLAADMSAQLESVLPRHLSTFAGLIGMLNPLKAPVPTGLFGSEPYDPNRIPVILVHGLQSVPTMWADLWNDLDANPKIAKSYQFYVYAYPTGFPLALNALNFREYLEEFEKRYQPRKGIVLVGHSMGGLMARLQTVETGRAVWDGVFDEVAQEVWEKTGPDDPLRAALVLKPNQQVERMIFLAVPHRGSELADNWIGAIGRSLVKIPIAGLAMSLGGSVFESVLTGEEVQAVFERHRFSRGMPNSVTSLSPTNPLLLQLDQLPISAPHHSIIGNNQYGKVPDAESTDGIVPYWSSHLESAESELVLPGHHGIFHNPDSTVEIVRILEMHLSE